MQGWWGGERLFITPSCTLLHYSSCLAFAVCPYSQRCCQTLWSSLLALLKNLLIFPGDCIRGLFFLIISFLSHLHFLLPVCPSCFRFCSLLLAVGLVETLVNASTFTSSLADSGSRLSFWLNELLHSNPWVFFCSPVCLVVVMKDVSHISEMQNMWKLI